MKSEPQPKEIIEVRHRILYEDVLTAPDEAPRAEASTEAAYWKAKYEEERQRLAKLWVAYKDLEAELAASTMKEPDAPITLSTVVVAEPPMPFQYGDYTLYEREVKLKSGKKQIIHFFARGKPRHGRPVPMPEGFEVTENPRNHLPILRREGGLTAKIAPKHLHPQCAAFADDGQQCRNSARKESRYCASHIGYQPRSIQGFLASLDTKPKSTDAVDTRPSVGRTGKVERKIEASTAAAPVQCHALTDDGGLQCKNSARDGSKYCSFHRGYRAPSLAHVVDQHDTRPRVTGAADTWPALRGAL